MSESYYKTPESFVKSQKANITIVAVDMSGLWLRVVVTFMNVLIVIHYLP